MKKTPCVNILILLLLIPSLFLTFSCSLFESDEEKAERHYQAGMQAIEEKKTDAAVIHFRNAVQKNPYHAEAHYRLGTLYIGSKQPHLAEGEFKQAIKHNPDLHEAKRALALLYFQNRAYSRAIPLYKELMERAGADIETLLILGTALINTGQVAEAKKILSEAVSTYPDNASAKINMARVLLLEKKPEEARTMMEAAAAIDHDNILTRLSLAQFYEGTRLHALAESTFLTIKQEFPDKPIAYLALARFYLRQGRMDDAEALLREATGTELKDPSLFQALAIVQHRKNNRAGALRSFQDAVAASPDDQRSAILLADYYVVLKQYPQAIETYEKIIGKWPELLPVKAKIAELLLAERRDGDALKHIEGLLKDEPEYARGHVLRGILLRKEGKVAEAREEFSMARVLDPKSAEGDYYYGLTFHDDQKYEISLSEILQALQKDPSSLRTRLTLAYIYLKTGKTTQAMEEIGLILKREPENRQAMVLRAAAHVQAKNYDDAVSDYRAILKQTPDLPLIRFQLAQVYRLQGNLDEALKGFRDAMETSPDPVRPLQEMAKIYVERKQYREAVALCDEYLAKHPGHLQVSIIKATVFLSRKDYEAAKGLIARLIAENPESDLPLTMMATVATAEGDYNAALETYRKIIALNPQNFPAYMKMAYLHRTRGDMAQAIDSYEALLSINESYGPAANDLAYIYADMNRNLDRALTLALKAKELIPGSGDVTDTLGWVYLKKGAVGMAKNRFIEAIQLNPGHPVFHYHLGLAYYQEKEFQKAEGAFREAIKLGLGKEDAAEARKVIAAMRAKG